VNAPRIALLLWLFLPSTAAAGTASGTWSLLSTGGPEARSGHVLVYDPPRDRLLLHGGWNGAEYLDDLWEYTLATDGPWTRLEPIGEVPSARAFHASTYDPDFQRLWMHGGRNDAALGDVWRLDLRANPLTWVHVGTDNPPAARYGHTMVYSSQHPRPSVFGGTDGVTTFNDLIELDTRRSPPAWITPGNVTGTPPSPRSNHQAIFTPAISRLFIFGGGNGTDALSDLWDLPYFMIPSPGWKSVESEGEIRGRSDHSMVHDRVRDRLLVYGGKDGATTLNDVWAATLPATYPFLQPDRVSWGELSPSGLAPSARSGHRAAYDPIRDQMLLFGGRGEAGGALGDLWALTLGANTAIDISTTKSEVPFSPGDTLILDYSIQNPFASPTEYEFRVANDRPWPYAHGVGGITVYQPIGHLTWGFVVPDTAAVGNNGITLTIWVRNAPARVDSCRVLLKDTRTPVPPPTPRFELRRAWYRSGTVLVEATLAAAPVRIDLLDVTGRNLASRTVEARAGTQGFRIPCDLRSGIYFVRLTQGQRSAGARLVALH